MAGPLIVPVAAAAAGRVALPVLVRHGVALATNIFTRNPATVTAAASRTGLAAIPGRILAAMKDNKILTALVLMDLGSEGLDILEQMAAADEDVAQLMARYNTTITPVPESLVADMAGQMEEFDAIRRAANSLGGLNALHNLRYALRLPEQTYQAYDQASLLAQVVR